MVLDTVAELVPYKGKNDVIEAIKVLKKESSDVNYKIVKNADPERLKK